jgi:hypothetical protein
MASYSLPATIKMEKFPIDRSGSSRQIFGGRQVASTMKSRSTVYGSDIMLMVNSGMRDDSHIVRR